MNIEPNFCRVDEAMDVLIGKWKLVIVLHLLHHGTLRFNELKRQLPHITNKTLTEQLRELEEDDIVLRVVYAEVPPKVEYSITEYGKSLEPILNALHEWGKRHLLHKTHPRLETKTD